MINMNFVKFKILVILTLLFTVFIPLSCLTAAVENNEFIMNGTFEKGSGTPSFWSVPSGYGASLSNDAAGSAKSLKLSDERNIYITQMLLNIVGGTKYELSADVKFGIMQGTVDFRATYFSKDEYGEITGYGSQNFSVQPVTSWSRHTFTAEPPKGTEYIVFYILTYSCPLVYIDNLSLIGYKNVDTSYRNLIPANGENLMQNYGFEGGTNSWLAYGGWTGGIVTISDEVVYSGTKSVKISEESSNSAPWVRQLKEVEPGCEYLFVTHVYYENLISGSAYTKLEFSAVNKDGSWTSVQQPSLGSIPAECGWITFYKKFEAPPNADVVYIYQRLAGLGTVYFDDTELYRLTDRTKFDMNTDEVFYYSDTNKINVSISGNKTMPGYEGFTFDISLKDGENVISEKKNLVLSDNSIAADFNTSLLTEKKKEYTIKAVMRNNLGVESESISTGIYLYDRPANLRTDGTYQKDGEPFYPIYAYHIINSEDYDYLSDAGINVIQIGWNHNIDPNFITFEKTLDTLSRYNLMGMVNLYQDNKPAGSLENSRYTQKIVEKYKNDPRIYAWMVMDETFWSMTYNEAVEQCVNSYKIIRGIDDMHPTFMSDNYAATFKFTARYADIFSADAYPGGATESPTTYVSNMGESLNAAANGRSPCLTLQLYEWNGFWPTSNQVRNMAYQSLFEGIPFGYFTFGDSKKDANGKNIVPLYKTELWDTVCNLGQIDYPMASKVFLDKSLPSVSEVRNDDVWYKSWMYGGELYLVAMNRSNANSVTVNIPIINTEGILISGFSAEVISGGSGKTYGNSTLSVTLEPSATPLYKITPFGEIYLNGDFESVTDKSIHMEPDGWKATSYGPLINSTLGGTITASTEKARNGYALKMDSGTSGGITRAQITIPVKPGACYECRGWVYVAPQAVNPVKYSSGAALRVGEKAEQSASGNWFCWPGSSAGIRFTEQFNTWQEMVFTFKIPANYTSSTAVLVLDFNDAVSGGRQSALVYWDDINIKNTTDFRFYDVFGNKITTLGENNSVVLKALYSGETTSAVICLIALFTKDAKGSLKLQSIKKIDVDTFDLSGTTYVGEYYNIEETITLGNANYIKVMLWDSLNKVAPLAECSRFE